jgi:hypothetical protein
MPPSLDRLEEELSWRYHAHAATEGGREVSTVAGVCDTAFAITLPDSRIAVIAGRAG